jgi:hypothetical protein
MKLRISAGDKVIERDGIVVADALPPKVRRIVGAPFEARRARVQLLAAASKRKNEKKAMRKKLTVLDGGFGKSTPL